MECGSEIKFDMEPDYSLLPDVVWVNILAHLNWSDRHKVSQTCSAMYEMFQHPSVWHTVKIKLDVQDNNSTPCREEGKISPERYLQMVKQFGSYFQDLTIIIVGFVDHIPQNGPREVIIELSERCRLKKLTLHVGIFPKKAGNLGVPQNLQMDELVAIVANSYRLKSFYLKAWPLYQRTETIDILDALKANPKIKKLESLDLFWRSAEKNNWVPRNAFIPSPDITHDVVQGFAYLHSLAIQSSMLCEDIIFELAKSHRASLKRLAILITYTHVHNEPPEISCKAWQKLCNHCPDVKVEFTVATRIPCLILSDFLKSQIPVSTISFMKYSVLRVDDLMVICEKYSQTICKFVSLVDDDDHLDNSLKCLIARSPNLTNLVYHGALYHQTVLDIASLKGCNWFRLAIPEKSISFCKQSETFEFGEEVVVVRTADGEFVLADTLRFATQEDDERPREPLLEELYEQVSEIIQNKWTANTIERT